MTPLVAIGVFLVLLVLIVPATFWLKHQFGLLMRKALREAREDFSSFASQQLDVEREKGASDLRQSEQQVEHAVQGLREQLARYEHLMKTFESDRAQKYGRLEGELRQVAEETGQLRQRTSDLVAFRQVTRMRVKR